MQIFVTGGSGFVGSHLVPHLVQAGHGVTLLLRPKPGRRLALPDGVRVVEGDPMRAGPWREALGECDAAVNLIGEQIHGRWTAAKKARLRETRLLPLRHLCAAIPRGREFTLLSASAVGYYGSPGEREIDEGAPAGSDFLARLAREWEAQALAAEAAGARVIITRLAMVLGAHGGALPEMIRQMHKLTGGIIGSGRQWVSWIHEDDVARAVCHLLQRRESRGAYNLGSPRPVRQIELAGTLGRLIGRPAGMPTPAAMLRLAVGEFAEVLLASQRMQPRRLLEEGFEFRYPELREALQEILQRQGSEGG